MSIQFDGDLRARSGPSGRPSVLEPYFEPDPFYSEEFSEHEQEFNNGIREITVRTEDFRIIVD